MEIVESLLMQNPCYRAGQKITVKGLMLHSVGCSQPSAEVFIKKWNNPNAPNVCVHGFIDGNTGKIYQTLPWEHRAWHAGGSANNTHIGVEMCEPACIKYTGGSSFSCSDREVALAVVKRTYDAAVELFAYLCKKFDLDPLADGVIISHKEGHDRGLASGHGDPNHLWDGLGAGYTMDGFRRDVKLAMGKQNAPGAVPPPSRKPGIPGMPKMPKAPGAMPPHLMKRENANQGGKMQVSDQGTELVAKYEGCRLEAYRCPAGIWTIGYGHTEGVKEGDRLSSVEEAKALLKADLQKYAGYVNQCMEKGILTFIPNQNQFDALTSFCYNCGNGNLQKLVSGRDAAAIADSLPLYNKGGGKVLPGLVKRRAEEKALFLS